MAHNFEMTIDAEALEPVLAFLENFEDEVDDSKPVREAVDSLISSLGQYAEKHPEFDERGMS